MYNETVINGRTVWHVSSDSLVGERVSLEDDMDSFCVAVFGKHPEEMETVDENHS